MFFKTKPRKITLDFFTTSEIILATSAPYRGVRKMPNWWKTLPSNTSFDSAKNNMRTCPGFVDLYLKSVVLPMWCDAEITIGSTENLGEWRVVTPDARFGAEEHFPEQYNNTFPPELFQHIKFSNPWKVRANTDACFLLHDAHWGRSSQKKYFMVPGVTPYNIQHSLEINTFFHKTTEEQVTRIAVGSPIAYITPMTELDFEVACHLVDEIEFKKLTPTNVSFTKNLQTAVRAITKLKKENTCK